MVADRSMLAHALSYAERGFSVVPVHSAASGKCSCGNNKCESPGKHPRINWKNQSQVALTAEKLRQYWRAHPDSNIGIVTGHVSELVVIDIDGDDGIEALRTIGLDIDDIEAPIVQSGGGGLHIYCQYPEMSGLATRAGVLPSVDIRADGGLIIAPPSIHPSGSPYEWIDGMTLDDLPLADLDLSWATTAHNNGTNGKVHHKAEDYTWFEELLTMGVSEGARNQNATRLAGRMLGMGHTENETLLWLQGWNLANDPPLSRRELETIVGSISRLEYEDESLDRSERLRKINDILRKVELEDAIRITGDDPHYVVRFREGVMHITSEQLLSGRQFQAAVLRATNQVIKEFGPRHHPRQDEIAKMIIDVCRDEDAGPEATALGDLDLLMADFLDSQRIQTLETLDEVPKHGCFHLTGGSVWIGLGEFVDWANNKAGHKMARPQTAQQLKRMGWRRDEFRTDEQGKRPAWSKA